MKKIIFKNVSKYYKTKNKVTCGVYNINLLLNSNELVLLKGPSGSGKTTLLNLLAGTEKPDSGEIIIDDNIMSQKKLKSISSIAFQNHKLINNLTVKDNLSLYLNIIGLSKKTNEKIDKLLKKLNLYEQKNKKISKLSLGEAGRVSLIRALINPSPILLLDEPSAAQDDKNSKIIYNILKEEAKKRLVVVVSHKEDELMILANKIITISNHEIISEQIKDNKNNHRNNKINLQNYTIKNKLKNVKLLLKSSINIFLLITTLYFIMLSLSFSVINNMKKNTYNITKYNFILQNLKESTIIINKKNKEAFTKENIKFLKKNGLTNISDNFLMNEKIILFYKKSKLKVDIKESKTDKIVLYLDRQNYEKYNMLKRETLKLKCYNYSQIIYINNIKKGYNFISIPEDMLKEIKSEILKNRSIILYNNKIYDEKKILRVNSPNAENISLVTPYQNIILNNESNTFISEYYLSNIFELKANFPARNQTKIKNTLVNNGYNVYFGSNFLYFDKTPLEILTFLKNILLVITLTIINLFLYFVLRFLVPNFKYLDVLKYLDKDDKNTIFICLMELFISMLVALILILIKYFIFSQNLKYTSLLQVFFTMVLTCLITFASCIKSIKGERYDRA